MEKEPTVFGKNKNELGLMLESISSRIDKNHPSSNIGYNSLKYLEEGMSMLDKDSGARETFGVN
jgi:hypothetical protein